MSWWRRLWRRRIGNQNNAKDVLLQLQLTPTERAQLERIITIIAGIAHYVELPVERFALIKDVQALYDGTLTDAKRARELQGLTHLAPTALRRAIYHALIRREDLTPAIVTSLSDGSAYAQTFERWLASGDLRLLC